VTSSVNALVGGAILNGMTEYPKDGHRYEIELRLVAPQRNHPAQLNDLQVRDNRGEVIPLSKLVDLNQKPALQLISRLNRARAITVYANLAPGHSNRKCSKLSKKCRKRYCRGLLHQTNRKLSELSRIVSSLVFALFLGLVVSYMVLASQFNSFIHPVIVLMALPFSISGRSSGFWRSTRA